MTTTKNDKLFNKDFSLVLIGQIISLFGNAILRFALPLYLLKTTGSEALFGVVIACSFLPMIVLSILGGVLADRVNKRNIMVFLDFFTAGVILIFSLLLGKIDIVPLFIVSLMLLYGIQGAYQPAVQASIPALEKDDNITSANACINLVSTLSNLLGPIFGGILFASFGLTPILIISIGCFLFSAIMEIFIKIPFTKQKTKLSVTQLMKSDIKDSMRFLKHEQPAMFKVGILLALFNMVFSSLITIGAPILVTKTLSFSDDFLGYAQAALAAGGIFGGLLMGVLGKKLKIQKSYSLLILSAICIFPVGISLLLAPAPVVTYIIILVSFFFSMAIATMFTIQALSYVQSSTPEHLVGKVVSSLIAISMCASPIGSAMYGFLFDWCKEFLWVLPVGAGALSVLFGLFSIKIFKSIKVG